MSNRLRGFGLLLAMAFGSDPFRTVGFIVLQVIDSLSQVLFALWLGTLVDGAVTSDQGRVLTGVIGMLGTLIAHELSNWMAGVLRVIVEEKTSFAIDQKLMTLSAEVPGIEHHELPRYSREFELLRQQRAALASTISAAIFNLGSVAQMAGTATLLGRIHPLLILLPLFALPSLLVAGKSEQIRERRREEEAEPLRFVRHLRELTSSGSTAKEIRIFDLGPELIRRQGTVWREIERRRANTDLRAAMLTGGGWLVFSVGFIATIGFVISLAVDGRASPGAVLLTLQLAAQVNQQVASAAGLVTFLLRTLKAVDRYLWLIDFASARQTKDIEIEPPERLHIGARLSNLSFTYPGTEKEVLKNVDLTIPAGSVVALVGENGAGKTTLVKLLLKLYEPTEGSVLIDGRDLKAFPPGSWRARCSAGFQDFMQFELLLQEAVGVGDIDRVESTMAVTLALERANAPELLNLPRRLETQLGKRFNEGLELSTGQWQKVALSRALMREWPLLLVLDEPTASLDAMTEHKLFERYASASRRLADITGTITLLVSHRFSTVRMADLIIVLKEGEIKEVGSHAELMRRGGLYQELFALQAEAYR